jgi:hypothetical protein
LRGRRPDSLDATGPKRHAELHCDGSRDLRSLVVPAQPQARRVQRDRHEQIGVGATTIDVGREKQPECTAE